MKTAQEEAIEALENYQLKYLKIALGDNYIDRLNELNDKKNFIDFIGKDIENEVGFDEAEKAEMKDLLKDNITNSNYLHTKYELFTHSHILKKTSDKFRILNPHHNFAANVYLGTVLSDQISAETGYDEEINALFILFDGEFINVALQLSKLIAQIAPLTNSSPYIKYPLELEDFKGKIFKNDKVDERIIGVLYFSIFKKPTDFPQYFLTDIVQKTVAFHLSESIEYFVFAHEMGHYFNGDLEPKTETLSDEEKIKRDWNEEFAADAFALRKLLVFSQLEENLLSLLGPEIFFNFCALREKHDNRIKGSVSHPPALERLKTYRALLTMHLTEEENTQMENYQRLIDALFAGFEVLVVGFAKFNAELKNKTPLDK